MGGREAENIMNPSSHMILTGTQKCTVVVWRKNTVHNQLAAMMRCIKKLKGSAARGFDFRGEGAKLNK